jgi:ubiquinone biosynthesis protein
VNVTPAPADERSSNGAAGQSASPGGPPIEIVPVRRPPGLLRRSLVTVRHTVGLLMGAYVAAVRERTRAGRGRPRLVLLRLLALLVSPFVKWSLVKQPFPVQLRRRLELLGPTYVKLGQILAMRTDLLPTSVTDELQQLLDRLPAIPFESFKRTVEHDLGRPLGELFASVDPVPYASASIAQAHRARTFEGDDAILKVVKPGIRQTLRHDAVLLGMVGSFLQIFFGRFQPKRLIREFTDYTVREVDLQREAENIETFSANFKDAPDIVFPRVFHDLSSSNVLCMEFLDGMKPTAPEAQLLPEEDKARLIELGAEAIIRMLYKDGFFHADLHPANLLILPGPRVGFIDLGMVGRLDDDVRRTLLYYFYCLVIGDVDNAARYLTGVAIPGSNADPQEFRREVEDLSRRWRRAASFDGFSLARLILASLARSARHHMYFPVEMMLMVKALVTYEAVGHLLVKEFDVAAVSKPFISRIFIGQFNPLRIARETLRGAPEIVDALIKAPLLVTEGLKVLERATRKPPSNPLTGVRGTLYAGFCLLAGAILVAFGKPVEIWAPLFLISLILALRRGS